MIILDEFVKTAGYDRKYAAKLLRGAYIYVKGEVHRQHRTYTKEDQFGKLVVQDQGIGIPADRQKRYLNGLSGQYLPANMRAWEWDYISPIRLLKPTVGTLVLKASKAQEQLLLLNYLCGNGGNK